MKEKASWDGFTISINYKGISITDCILDWWSKSAVNWCWFTPILSMPDRLQLWAWIYIYLNELLAIVWANDNIMLVCEIK